MADTAPIIYDENDNPIEVVTVEAMPLPNWLPYIAITVALWFIDDLLEG